MRIPFCQVDAFASRPFEGNPAVVCPLESWLPDATLQAIAAEHNLSETAFYIARSESSHSESSRSENSRNETPHSESPHSESPHSESFDLRWFTPQVEVDLCGHATLATAHVILAVRQESRAARVIFHTRSGELAVERDDNLYTLDFPSRPPQPCAVPETLAAALGAAPRTVMAARDYLCVFDHEDEVIALQPDMTALAALDRFAVIVTAPGTDCDFVSRFFAPAKGVPEDPVTGSAHCTLIPYWAERLAKSTLFARQRSRRGGELWCGHHGARVAISGRAVTYSQGVIEI